MFVYILAHHTIQYHKAFFYDGIVIEYITLTLVLRRAQGKDFIGSIVCGQ